MLLIISVAVVVPFVIIAILLQLHKRFEWPWLERILSRYDRYTEHGRRRRFPIIELIAIPIILVALILATRRVRAPEPEFDNRIAVLADSTAWRLCRDDLASGFEHVIRTPQEEKTFILHYQPHLRELSRTGYAYFLILAVLEPGGDISDHALNTMLNEDQRRLVKERSSLLVTRKTEENQLISILAARDHEALRNLLAQKTDSLSAVVRADAMNQMRRRLFSHDEEAVLANDLLKAHGWALQKQSNLMISDNDAENRFVSFGSWTGKRWMFIHWEEARNVEDLSPDWVIRKRDSLCAVHYGTIRVEDHYLNMTVTTFLDRPAIMTRGLWADDEPVMGGPFTNFTFHDEKQKRLYMIDMFVYRPGALKLSYLLPMEVLAHTFVTREDLQQK